MNRNFEKYFCFIAGIHRIMYAWIAGQSCIIDMGIKPNVRCAEKVSAKAIRPTMSHMEMNYDIYHLGILEDFSLGIEIEIKRVGDIRRRDIGLDKDATFTMVAFGGRSEQHIEFYAV